MTMANEHASAPRPATDGGNALDIGDLRVGRHGVTMVRGVSFTIPRGHRMGLVGESGAGKTITAMAAMRLLDQGWETTGTVVHDGVDLLSLTDPELSRRRGRTLSMVFQDPHAALNPVARVGDQISSVIRRHIPDVGRADARRQAADLLERMHLPRVPEIMKAYPHQLSGGQLQRVMIAMALACSPDLIIADEPTTALDVTVQKQVLRLLDDTVTEHGCSLLLISHDLPVIAAMCDQVAVMYAGRIVESGTTSDVFSRPRHPYTRALLESQPTMENVAGSGRLPYIPGMMPNPADVQDGCAFRDRCSYATASCTTVPQLTDDTHAVACWHPLQPTQAEVTYD